MTSRTDSEFEDSTKSRLYQIYGLAFLENFIMMLQGSDKKQQN